MMNEEHMTTTMNIEANNSASHISSGTEGESRTSPVVVPAEVEASSGATSTSASTASISSSTPDSDFDTAATEHSNNKIVIEYPSTVPADTVGGVLNHSNQLPHDGLSTASPSGRPPPPRSLVLFEEEVGTQRINEPSSTAQAARLEQQQVQQPGAFRVYPSGLVNERNDHGDEEGNAHNNGGNVVVTVEASLVVGEGEPGAFRAYHPSRIAWYDGNDDDHDDHDDHRLSFRSARREQQSSNVHLNHGGVLVEANLVVDVEEPPERLLVDAEPVVDESKSNRLKVILLVLAVAVIVGLVVGLSVGLLTSNNIKSPTTTSTNGAPTLNPTAAPTLDWNDAFHSSLPDYTKAAIEDDPDSPQYRAFVWETQADQVPNSVPQDKRILRMTQRFALATFYYASHGNSSWSVNDGWVDPSLYEGNWYGCSLTQDDKIYSLDFSSNRLNGTLPKELSLLSTSLEYLSLYDEYLMGMMGSIPSELGKLSKLTHLDLASNRLNGKLPTQLGSLTHLEYLSISANTLTGSIPSELGSLSKLTDLILYENRLSGLLPTQLGDLTNLAFVGFDGNELTGSLPPELSTLSKLTDLFLLNNKLNGTLPAEIGRLESLSALDLSNNNLTGTIPSELGSLRKLTILNLHENQLDGSMPVEICDLIEANAIPEDDAGMPLEVAIDCDLIQCNCSKGCTCGSELDFYYANG